MVDARRDRENSDLDVLDGLIRINRESSDDVRSGLIRVALGHKVDLYRDLPPEEVSERLRTRIKLASSMRENQR